MGVEKYINEYDKECYKGVVEETPFGDVDFHRVPNQLDDDKQWALHTNIGSLTVLDRMTGFGYRDIETGYRDMEGEFWLASGNNDVRHSGCNTVGEAIKWVKDRANTCNPARD